VGILDRLVDYDYAAGLRRTAIANDAAYEAYGSDFSPDGQLAASWSFEGVRLWDVASAVEVGKICEGYAFWARFARRRGQLMLVISTSAGVTARSLEYRTGERRLHLGPVESIVLPPEIECATEGVVSVDGHTLVLSSSRPAVYAMRFDAAAPPALAADAHGGRLAISSEGRWVAMYRSGRPGVGVWSPTTGERPRICLEHQPIHGVAFEPATSTLTVDNGREIVGVDARSGDETVRVPLPQFVAGRTSPSELRFTRDGGLVAIARESEPIALVDWRRRSVAAALPVDLPRTGIALAPDGRSLACTGADLVLQFWRLRDLRDRLAPLHLDW
jgi:WD40 repeat protein